MDFMCQYDISVSQSLISDLVCIIELVCYMPATVTVSIEKSSSCIPHSWLSVAVIIFAMFVGVFGFILFIMIEKVVYCDIQCWN